MNYQREIERKYVVANSTMEDARWRLDVLYPGVHVYEGVSTDTFWTQKGTDFIRLRRNTSELSVKVTDKGTIEDRLEENVVVGDFDTAQRFSTAVFGQPVGTLEKTYYVMETADAVISLYTVTGDNRLFIEVEANNITAVINVESDIREHFDLTQETHSLFQLIFGEVV